MHVYILATMDTKGAEAAFVRDRLRAAGVSARLVDTGSFGPPAVEPDVPRAAVFAAAGTTPDAVRAGNDRGAAVNAAAAGARRLVLDAHARGDLAGVLGLGGSAGTIIGTEAMRALPLGVPKLMVSTLASGQVKHYVGGRDIFMLNAVVDISGINRISRLVLGAAADAMAGLAARRTGAEPTADARSDDRPIVALTMFGVTTPCVEQARAVIEAAGYETLVFHATGSGGRNLEGLVRDGLIAGVLDLTTTELADELVGGFLTAGPERLTAAGAAGLPQVVSVGATDMVNFFAPDTVPARFAGRRFHQHDAQVTLMRTNAEENAAIGADIGRKVAAARGPTAVLLPARGVSALDQPGRPFDDPAARRALFDAVRAHAGAVPVTELDHHINDRAFAEAAAHALLGLLGKGP
jgi:uncharacterized protein (UPF0261 family)